MRATSRIVSVGAALGIVLGVGAVTTASATPVHHMATTATAVPSAPAHHRYGGGGDEECTGVIVLLCN